MSVSGMVTRVQRYSVHDGPGIRTTVFLKGCPLRCLWCHNPEGQTSRIEVMFVEERCLRCGACVAVCPNGVHDLTEERHRLERAQCRECGRCIEACYAEALAPAGQRISADEVWAEVERDLAFYRTSGGGLTLSGGEPLAQPEFSLALLRRGRAEGLSTAMETCGYGRRAIFSQLLGLCDLVYFDLKAADPDRHRRLTGRTNEPILSNLGLLAGAPVPAIVRIPVVPGCNDSPEELAALGDLVATAFTGQSAGSLLDVELLPYHAMGAGKYRSLGRRYGLAGLQAPTPETMEEAAAAFRTRGLRVTVRRH